jgi:hypothetical protein
MSAPTVIDRIIKCEQRADELDAEISQASAEHEALRWEAAELIVGLLSSRNMTQVLLAKQIGKDQSHVSRVARAYRIREPGESWNSAYQRAKRTPANPRPAKPAAESAADYQERVRAAIAAAPKREPTPRKETAVVVAPRPAPLVVLPEPELDEAAEDMIAQEEAAERWQMAECPVCDGDGLVPLPEGEAAQLAQLDGFIEKLTAFRQQVADSFRDGIDLDEKGGE